LKTKFLANFSLFVLILSVITIAYSCKSDDIITVVGPDANSINGTVTFADSGFVSTGGIYLISAFSSWPPAGPPAAYDTVRISRNSSTGRWNQSYSYKLSNIANGSYAVSVGFRKATGGQSPIMGVYGCDTTHNMCVITTTSRATITGNAGVTGIDFSCWADTTKKLY